LEATLRTSDQHTASYLKRMAGLLSHVRQRTDLGKKTTSLDASNFNGDSRSASTTMLSQLANEGYIVQRGCIKATRAFLLTDDGRAALARIESAFGSTAGEKSQTEPASSPAKSTSPGLVGFTRLKSQVTELERRVFALEEAFLGS